MSHDGGGVVERAPSRRLLTRKFFGISGQDTIKGDIVVLITFISEECEVCEEIKMTESLSRKQLKQ